MAIFPHLSQTTAPFKPQRRLCCARGFTLVELVTIIIILGVLAVAVLPRLTSSSSYSAHSLRSEFLGELRKAQLQALNNSDICFRLAVNAKEGYRLERYAGRSGNVCTGSLESASPWQAFEGGSSLMLNGNDNFVLDFDTLGRLPGTGCAGPCIQVLADETLMLAIESEGYIHGA